MTLFYFAIAWIVGVAVATLSPNLTPIWPVLAVGGLIVALITRRDITGRRIGLCMIMAGLGMWRLASARPGQLNSDDLATYNDSGPARLTGIIADLPADHGSDIHLRVEVQSIELDKQNPQVVHGLALVYADRSGHYAYGDKIEISGNPSTPPTFDTFSYEDYLARSDVYTLVSCYPAGCPHITVLEHGQGNPLLATMFDIKSRSRQLVGQLLPNPQSGLLTGMLLGDATQIPPETSNDFSQTGTTHLIAISGSNITIVAGLLFAIFSHLGNKRLAAVAMIVGIVVYTIFTGASASTVRAVIMGVLVILAVQFGRRSDGLTALAASVWVMTILNPLLLFDIGLVLSSAATLGLILYTEPLTRWAEGLISRLFHSETTQKIVDIFSDSVLITIAAQITTLPIIVLVFGQFSLISFPVNILVVPAEGMIMSLGILAVIAGTIFLPAGQIVAWLVAVPLTYMLAVIHAAAMMFPSQPFTLSPAAFAAYYIVLFGVTAVYTQPPEKRGQVIQWMKRVVTVPATTLLGLAIAGLIWTVVISRPDGKLHVWFLGVGKGNAVLIQTPHGAHILVDGGENPTQLSGAIGNRLPFYQHDLDALFITQHKPETITALPPLLDRYTPKVVISNGQIFNDSLYATLADTLLRTGTQTIPAWAGYQFKSDDGVKIEVMNPSQEVIPKADNPKPADPPLVLRLTYGNASFLLTSQLSQDDMKGLAGLPLQSVVLELPSNGAEKINTPDWINAIAPQVAVVEAEAGDPNAQPAPSVLKTLDRIPVYRTDDQGTVEVATDGNQLWISPDRGGR